MNAVIALWLPILLSAVVVFVISSLVHMVFKWHNSDYHGFSNEDAVRDAVRAGNPAPGLYVLPYCTDMKEMAGEGMQKKYKEGPVGFVSIMPSGAPGMGRQLGQWFALTIVVSAMTAFIAGTLLVLDPSRARAAGKLAGAITFMAYGIGTITESIWMGRTWGSTAKHVLDSALYGLGSGFVFWWLWPDE